ncbi:MAG TPA: FHA domain-containing protein [Gemmata sp.]|jgi:pSer/pThr/pTyr-binding forkhead associated (FHA) protein|nr:FHA domain-containing protein [Gemmata sp.]
MRARLVSLDGGPAVEIDKDLTLVGRDDHCDVKLDHKSVSKLHCVIVRTDGLLLLRDLGSTNGTRVNGTRVRRAALLPNDVLAVATLRYTVKFGVELEEELAREAVGPARLNPLPDVYPDQKLPRDTGGS